MSMQLEELIAISLPKGTLLVLFEYLARSCDAWQKDRKDEDTKPYLLLPPDIGERHALWHFERAIEKTLPELFSPDYQALVTEWKRQLILNNGEEERGIYGPTQPTES
jgi:hypothetical protein